MRISRSNLIVATLTAAACTIGCHHGNQGPATSAGNTSSYSYNNPPPSSTGAVNDDNAGTGGTSISPNSDSSKMNDQNDGTTPTPTTTPPPADPNAADPGSANATTPGTEATDPDDVNGSNNRMPDATGDQ